MKLKPTKATFVVSTWLERIQLKARQIYSDKDTSNRIRKGHHQMRAKKSKRICRPTWESYEQVMQRKEEQKWPHIEHGKPKARPGECWRRRSSEQRKQNKLVKAVTRALRQICISNLTDFSRSLVLYTSWTFRALALLTQINKLC